MSQLMTSNPFLRQGAAVVGWLSGGPGAREETARGRGRKMGPGSPGKSLKEILKLIWSWNNEAGLVRRSRRSWWWGEKGGGSGERGEAVSRGGGN